MLLEKSGMETLNPDRQTGRQTEWADLCPVAVNDAALRVRVGRD